MVECFFFIEQENESDGTIRALCIDCKKKKPKDFAAWFYGGQVGPWTVRCHDCKTILHEVDDETSRSL